VVERSSSSFWLFDQLGCLVKLINCLDDVNRGLVVANLWCSFLPHPNGFDLIHPNQTLHLRTESRNRPCR
jgi:hypothetical protein